MSAALIYWPTFDEGIDRRRAINAALLALPARLERIVRLHMGINGPEMPLKEIAAAFSLSTTRISQMFAKAMRRMRRLIAKPRRKPLVAKCSENFGIASTRKGYSGPYLQLVPFIMAMRGEGATAQEIYDRILFDYVNAGWMACMDPIGHRVPSPLMVAYIIRCETG